MNGDILPVNIHLVLALKTVKLHSAGVMRLMVRLAGLWIVCERSAKNCVVQVHPYNTTLIYISSTVLFLVVKTLVAQLG